MPWICAYCGYENPDEEPYCLNCGIEKATSMSAHASPPPPPQIIEQLPPPQFETPLQPPVRQPAEEQILPPQIPPPSPPAKQPSPPPPQPPTEQPLSQVGQITITFVEIPQEEMRGKRMQFNIHDFHGDISVGRDPSNVLIVPDLYVSRFHGRIKLENGSLIYEDLGSSNGSYILDKKKNSFNKIEKLIKINSGDLIRLGPNTIIKIEYTEPIT